MGVQVSKAADFIAEYLSSGDLYGLIISIIETLPLAPFILVVILITMIAFYATSFDSIAYTASCYSYKSLKEGEKPHWIIQLMWCILLIVLPIALVFSESSMNNIQSVSIISAFPIGIVMTLIIIAFFIDSRHYLKELEQGLAWSREELANIEEPVKDEYLFQKLFAKLKKKKKDKTVSIAETPQEN
jgi:BCCT family betaine/carnitine transporter